MSVSGFKVTFSLLNLLSDFLLSSSVIFFFFLLIERKSRRESASGVLSGRVNTGTLFHSEGRRFFIS